MVSLNCFMPVLAQNLDTSFPFDESVLRIERLSPFKGLIMDYQGQQRYTNIKFNPYTHTVTGNGLCNKFVGRFSQNGNQLTLSDIKKSNIKCLSEDVNQQDNRFFQRLQILSSYEILGKVVKFLDSKKHVVMMARSIK
ncbi:META domain-containing protein [Commensalibacter sp. Nvir]|uniref:META domain-containing protein n=1 Tax=Commensalibacter sp. Nvir TaxID=3069817 RepID=UPI0030C8D262